MKTRREDGPQAKTNNILLNGIQTLSNDAMMVNKQDFLQVFQGSGIGKREDNLTSAVPLSYATNGSRGDLQILG